MTWLTVPSFYSFLLASGERDQLRVLLIEDVCNELIRQGVFISKPSALRPTMEQLELLQNQHETYTMFIATCKAFVDGLECLVAGNPFDAADYFSEALWLDAKIAWPVAKRSEQVRGFMKATVSVCNFTDRLVVVWPDASRR